MAKIWIRLKKSLLLRHINRLEYRVQFNESYLPIIKERFDQRTERKLERLRQKHQRMLLPLEIGTLDDDVYQDVMTTDKIQRLETAYDWKKRAVRQSHARAIKRNPDAKEAADAKRDTRLKQLDQTLDKKRKAILDKHQRHLDEDAIETNRASYKAKKAELDTEYQRLRTRLETKDEARFTFIRDKRMQKLEPLHQLLETKRAQLLKVLAEDPEAELLLDKLDEKDILKIEDLTMKFGGLKAVDDLSFTVKEGEIFGLIGPNGAGKTTVFNCITQFHKPNAGNLYYRNINREVVSLNSFKVHDVIKQGIVRTFQNVELIWELSILDNMLVGAHSLYKAGFFTQLLHLHKLKREEAVIHAKAIKILTDLDLILYKDLYPIGLPYGVLKRLELARTLMTQPNLIILDEPAAGLNDLETKSLADTLRKIRETYACTIFLVEHDMQLVMEVCDTICAINFGKKLAIGKASEIKQNKLVQEAYLGGE